jgi:hypothetical protein
MREGSDQWSGQTLETYSVITTELNEIGIGKLRGSGHPL